MLTTVSFDAIYLQISIGTLNTTSKTAEKCAHTAEDHLAMLPCRMDRQNHVGKDSSMFGSAAEVSSLRPPAHDRLMRSKAAPKQDAAPRCKEQRTAGPRRGFTRAS